MTKNEALKLIDEAGVRAGQSWQHYKGGRYTVLVVGIDEPTLTPVVVYAGHDGVVWVRQLAVFLENVENVDVTVRTPRFTHINDADGATKPFEKASWRPTDGCVAEVRR